MGACFPGHPFTITVWALLDFMSALLAGFIAFRIRLDPVVKPTTRCGVAAPGSDGAAGFDRLPAGVQCVPGDLCEAVWAVSVAGCAQRVE